MNKTHSPFFLLLLFLAAWTAVPVHAQQHTVRGVVRDSLTGEPLPYASLVVRHTDLGYTTDSLGRFSFTTKAERLAVRVSYLGYKDKDMTLRVGGASQVINLAPSGIALTEVTVTRNRAKYRKKDNPAVEFVRQVIARRHSNDPQGHDFFSYDHYEKMVFAKNDYVPKTRKDGHRHKLDFLSEYIDTLDNGVTILPVSEKERTERVYFRKSPKTERCVVTGYRSSGIDEIFSSDGVQQFLGEVFRNVDLFRNDIPLFLQRFVSPVSTIGPSFYKYYLEDTLEVDGMRCADLVFAPFNRETFGFTGHLYVTLDSTYFVKRAVLHVPHDINLNFVSSLTIEQDFSRTPSDSTRLLTRDDIQVYFKLTERTKGMYARRLSVFTNHSFAHPDEATAQVFRESAPTLTQEDAHHRSELFWAARRPAEVAQQQTGKGTEALMARLKAIPAWRISMQVLSTLFNGYIPTHKQPERSKFEFGPMNSTINYNTLEHTRLRVGGTTTTAFSRHLFFDGYMAYGTEDRKLKYDVLAEYSFNRRKEFRKEYPLHSLRLEYFYDIRKLGQDYTYTSKDNMVLMIRRKQDDFITYLRQAELTYYRELYSGVAYGAVLRNRREEASSLTGFQRIESDGLQPPVLSPVSHYDQTELELKFRYARNEKFYQTRNVRVPITFDALILHVSHRMAFRGLFGTDYNYQRTDLGVQKRFWLSAFGYIDFIAKAGKVWTRVPYPLLALPNANLTYTIQPETYTNMNALEFINDEYAAWDVTYYMNGNLLNRLPLIKKLRWREVFCFRGLWGHLTDKNNPAKSGGHGLFAFPETTRLMGSTPYMEASVGIENILKFLRIDYVWRLTYLGHPDIQKSGVRMTMALSF